MLCVAHQEAAGGRARPDDGAVEMMGMVLAVLREFLTLMVRVAPYLLLGAASAAAVQTYVSPRWASRVLGSGTRSVWLGSVLGAVLPGCSCAAGPMAEGLHRRGAGLGTVTAFLMMSPLLAPHTVVLTWGVLGWPFAVARVIIPFLAIPLLGVALNAFDGRPGWGALKPVAGGGLNDTARADDACAGNGGPGNAGFVTQLLGVLRMLGKPFLIGLAAAAVLTALLPEDVIPRTIGAAGPFAYLVAALVGIPAYVCEGEEVLLTYAALGLGLAPGPAFTFMLGSVGTCLPTMLMARRIIGSRATWIYAGAWFAFAIGGGVAFGAVASAR
jgi:uncharacterized membrane protein YraQ (UPF0718 family)